MDVRQFPHIPRGALWIRKTADKSEDRAPAHGPDGEEPIVVDGQSLFGWEPYPLTGVYVDLDKGVPLDHVMSRQYVEQGEREGWMVVRDDVLFIKASNVTIEYAIVEPPGEYLDSNAPGGRRVEHQYTLHLVGP